MKFERQVAFWLGALVLLALVLWLLEPILLPFVAGMVLAYLLDPLTNRLQRLGISRLIAALAVIGLFVLVFVLLILIIAPKFWFIAVIDFVIHITVDRAKGFCASTFGVTQENKHPWFWTLIGIDQALHHLTGFGLAVFMAANG